MTGWNRVGRWLGLVALVAMLWTLLDAHAWAWEYGDITDPDTWYEDLNLGKRTIYVWLSLSAGCIVLAYFFAGPVARELLALGIAVGFQVISTPELLTDPSGVFSKYWKQVSAGRGDDQMIIFFFIWLLVIFFLVMLIVNVQVMLNDRQEREAGYRSD